jgi:hypothetical protein
MALISRDKESEASQPRKVPPGGLLFMEQGRKVGGRFGTLTCVRIYSFRQRQTGTGKSSIFLDSLPSTHLKLSSLKFKASYCK